MTRDKKYPPPFSLRLSFDERANLEAMAGGRPVGEYIRVRLFGEPEPRRAVKMPPKDHEILAEILGKLGQSRLASNLNQLAKAAHSGALLVTPETENALRQAAAEIGWMRQKLLQGLGLREDSP
jgi:hypothetical protein